MLHQPTLPDRTCSSQAWVYMVFQSTRFTTATCCHAALWALTPLFSPLLRSKSGAVLSLRHFLSSLSGAFPLGSVVHCIVQTFLLWPKPKTMEWFCAKVVTYLKKYMFDYLCALTLLRKSLYNL